ncbi:hypothetical protein F4821DRAFT_238530 [Hypoxylon rubiginosum]|uniref:Uncharacterized protein n=1 Tax=Hypoxylon rubiginosum TaxID=110542 RepID=A0ACC0D0U1_9PEZI|nr:hypothetical protein F4821DRAFT_238530 [Hypoxylon rubiginosum]
MHEVQSILENAMSKYKSKQRFSVLRDRLKRLSSKIHYYGNVVDVLVQHHPEYVALVWGAMKFLFTAVMNHEYILKNIAQVMGQVADSLPCYELSYSLYSSERMEPALTDLYVNLLEFFIKAREWYDEGSLRRTWHSITDPWELKFQESYDKIRECSRRIERLAFAGVQAEVREIHTLSLASKASHQNHEQNNQQIMEKVSTLHDKHDLGFKQVIDKISALDGKHDLTVQQVTEMLSKMLDTLTSAQTLHSNALVDDNTVLTGPQVVNIISSISGCDSVWGCMKTYQYCRVTRNQRKNTVTQMQIRPFWLDPKLRKWTSFDSSGMVAIQGNASSRFLMKDFMINVIDELKSNNVTALWLLNPIGKSSASLSCTDAMKQLVLQVVQSCRSPSTEKSMAETVARIQGAKTSQDWAALLQSVLAQLNRQIYVLVDLEAFYDRSGGDNGILFLQSLWKMCSALSQQVTDPKVKVLVLSHGRMIGAEMSSCTVSVQGTQIPARRKKAFRGQRIPGILGARGTNSVTS